MDREQIIHDLAMEYVRVEMEDYREMYDNRTPNDDYTRIRDLYKEAVLKFSNDNI